VVEAASSPDTGSQRRQYPAKPADVYLFGTCLVDLFDPEAGISTVALLEREGIRVHYPLAQSCCGQPAYTSGYPEQARVVARRQLELFPNDWPIVVPSGSCAGMMRHHYPVLFADEPNLWKQVESVSSRIYELTEFLVHVCQVKLEDRGSPCKAVLHTSCSGRREMGTHLTSNALLSQLPGVEVVVQSHESECCGFGGTFSVRHPDISAAMASDKVDALLATGAKQLVSADCGCLSNLNGTLEKRRAALRGEHIATFLWKRTGGPA
jgi:L-lactate dehydrogenase complex protein LldE